MRSSRRIERRKEDRYPQSIELLVQELPEIGNEKPFNLINTYGRSQNISRKGLCIITSEPIRCSSLIRCEIRVCDPDVRIATLMEVRWTRKRNQETDVFVSGLEAIL